MQSWDALQRELVPCGFHAAAFVSFACPDHGRFRAGVAKLDPRIPCPRCGLACRANYLAEGLTRRPLPLIEAQLKSRPLRAWAKAHRNHEYVPEWLLSKWHLPVFEKSVTSHVQLRMV